jgi:hypothetical protein
LTCQASCSNLKEDSGCVLCIKRNATNGLEASMKVEVIVRRKEDIQSEFAVAVVAIGGLPINQEFREVAWEEKNGSVSFTDGVIFSFEATTVRHIDLHLTSRLNPYLNRRRVDKNRWLEKEVRVNGVLLPEFYRGMAHGYEKAVQEAIALLKRGRGRYPSEKEAQARKILEDALPENQNWLK